jgi:hypothetical protein
MRHGGLEARQPIIDLIYYLVLSVSILMLQSTFQLLTVTLNYIKIIVSEFSPLSLGFALENFPVSFDTIPVHAEILLAG